MTDGHDGEEPGGEPGPSFCVVSKSVSWRRYSTLSLIVSLMPPTVF